MKINGINYLTLEKHGCNFWDNSPEKQYSDVGNFRVFTEFTDKNGIAVCGDFASYNVKDYTKKTKPIKIYNALSTHLQYTNKDGRCYRYSKGNPENYRYTLLDILDYVNSISNEKYDAIKFVYKFEFIQEKDKNFVPAGKMVEWAKANRLNYYNKYTTTIINLHCGDYKYLCFKIEPLKDGKTEKVTIYLEEV
jgi:hypothetical protein